MGICKIDSECNYDATGLICRTSGESCGCPDPVGIGHCDCETRALDHEYYWNGSQCVDADLYGDACNNNYECQGSTYLSTCNSTTQKCVCLNNTYNVNENHGFGAKNISTPRNCSTGWTFL